MMRLKDKVALVTGGGSGIGRATALALSHEGARVIVSDVSEKGGRGTVRMVAAQGGLASFVGCDVSSEAEVERLIAEVLSVWGQLDCAFNNAGISDVRAVTGEYPKEAWDRVIATNLTGVFLCMKHELRQMAAKGSGVIVNNASVFGMVGFAAALGAVGFPGASAYVAAKHGVIGLTRSAAIEYGPRGIRVNAVCPGFVHTRQTAAVQSDEALHKRIDDLNPIGRMAEPSEIASAVVFLFSNDASFMTGHALVVDGGYTAQ